MTDGPDTALDEAAPPILWLTPACTVALGDCANPAILAEASEQKIRRLLGRAHLPPGEELPDPRHYRTWPEQAAMLAAGEYESLRNWQSRWLTDGEAPEVEPGDEENGPPPHRRWTDWDIWLAAALILLAASLISWLLWSQSEMCRGKPIPCVETEPVVDPTPTAARLELSTDAIFDYKMPGTYHPVVLNRSLERFFERLEGIEIVSVAGHTDPIGATADNIRLGNDRARTVLDAIGKLVGADEAKRFGPEPLPRQPAAGGAQEHDENIWRYCFERFQLQVPEARFRPLRNLDRTRNPGNRPECAAATTSMSGDAYPACAGPYDRTIPASLKVFAKQAENFREITACLSPMRHVVVNVKYDRLAATRP